MKTINLALFTLLDYFRRTWLYAEVISVAILIFFFRDGFRLLDAAQVFPALGIFSIVLTTVTTLRITHLETNTKIYIPLTKVLSRKDYLSGKALAIWALDASILLLVFILAFALTGIKQQFSFITGLIDLIPLLIILTMSATIMLCCSALVSTKTGFFWGILLLLFGSAQPWHITSFILPPINQLIISSFKGFHIWTIGQYLLALVYIVISYRLAIHLFSKRELNYEPK